MSGIRRNNLQAALDDIAVLNKNKSSPPEDGEYFSEHTRKLSAAEKRRKGEKLRKMASLE